MKTHEELEKEVTDLKNRIAEMDSDPPDWLLAIAVGVVVGGFTGIILSLLCNL